MEADDFVYKLEYTGMMDDVGFYTVLKSNNGIHFEEGLTLYHDIHNDNDKVENFQIGDIIEFGRTYDGVKEVLEIVKKELDGEKIILYTKYPEENPNQENQEHNGNTNDPGTPTSGGKRKRKRKHNSKSKHKTCKSKSTRKSRKTKRRHY